MARLAAETDWERSDTVFWHLPQRKAVVTCTKSTRQKMDQNGYTCGGDFGGLFVGWNRFGGLALPASCYLLWDVFRLGGKDRFRSNCGMGRETDILCVINMMGYVDL